MHPWWDRKLGLMDGDVGAWLYRHAHSLHHKSYNPGPWSGLSMHPIEHFFYYSCAWLPPLLVAVHPLHFLYAKYHADISPIGGHDGYGEPSANGAHHWLHHAKFGLCVTGAPRGLRCRPLTPSSRGCFPEHCAAPAPPPHNTPHHTTPHTISKPHPRPHRRRRRRASTECNYGVPFPVCFDTMFQTRVHYDDFKANGNKIPKRMRDSIAGRRGTAKGGAQAEAAVVEKKAASAKAT